MKKSHILLLFALCPLNFALAQQYGWVDISSRLPDYPNDTSIINGGADTLIANLTDICFVDDNNGWITTSSTYTSDEAAILHTTDGGNTWEVQTVIRPCQFIHMVDANTGYAASAGGTIFKTSDGGQNWLLFGATGTNVTGMSFPPGSDTGYLCSYAASRMHRITPEGLETINFDNAPFWWQSISAASHDLIWISNLTSVYTYDQDGLTDQPVTSDNYNSINFKRNDLGWGCGSHGVKDRNQGTIMGCVGKNIPWVVLSYTDGPLYDVFALDEDHIWVAGAEGQIYYSVNASDFGFDTQTSTGWSNVEIIRQPVPVPDVIIRSVFFTSEQNGYASANENILLKYGPVSGTNELALPDIELYPNPTSGKFQITSTKHQTNSKNQIQKCEVVDIYGNIKDISVCDLNFGACLEFGARNLEFDITRCPAGIYFIRINFENQTIVKKIIKL